MEMYPPVSIEVMRLALAAFSTALQRYPVGDKRRFKKAEAAVIKAVTKDWQNGFVYLGRCHAFRNLTSKTAMKGFNKWWLPDGDGFYFHEAVIDAVALTPMIDARTRFCTSDFLATVEKIAVERYGLLDNHVFQP